MMFQKCQVCGILPFEAFPIKSICFTIQGLTCINTLRCTKTLHMSINSTQVPSEKLLRHHPTSPDNMRHSQTPSDTKRHLKTPFDVNVNGHTSSNSLFGCLGVSVGVTWCLLLSVVVLNCPEITGGGFWEYSNGVNVHMFMRFGCDSRGVYEFFGLVWWSKRSILEKLRKAKFYTLEHFWNIKIPRPPYKSSLKIIGLLHFLKFLGLSFFITLY